MLNVPVASVGSLRGLPQRLTLKLNGRTSEGGRCARDIRDRLTELSGSHKSSAGLIYRGKPLADDVSLEAFSYQTADELADKPPRVLVYDRHENLQQPFHFFRTSSGFTLTIDERKDPRVRWASEEGGSNPIEKTVERARAMAPELKGWLTQWHYDQQGKTATPAPISTPAVEETKADEPGADGKDENDDEEEVLVEVAALKAGANVPVHRYTNLAPNVPHLAVVGGVHGNELSGMEGAQCVHEFLADATDPIAEAILERATVTVVPCVNTVGLAAGARCSPTLGSAVLRGEARIGTLDRRVYVGDHQHGSFFPPKDWSDPNRGWLTNDTLVKHALEQALYSSSSAPPEMVVWNHDWAIPNGSVIARGAPKDLYEKPMRSIFGKHYPSRTGFGKVYEHVITCDQATAGNSTVVKEPKYMSEALQATYNHADYTIESYCGGNATELHFEATLYLLARHSHVPVSEPALLAAVADATDRKSVV